MNIPPLEAGLLDQLKVAVSKSQAAGNMTPQQYAEYMTRFRDRFGPDALSRVEGEELLNLMHGRQDTESRCLSYWLEFKNDDEFPGYSFGGIGGGSALKFGVYQRQSDGAWMSRTGTQPRVISLEDAVNIARRQREELLAGDTVLRALTTADLSDEAYARLQMAMEAAAPDLSDDGWSHKYWYLMNPEKIDDYHSPRYQRFHLLKLLQMPPDHIGILQGSAPRFICAGRFIAIARALDVPVTILGRLLNERDGFHQYWRVGTTEGDSGESQWPAMRDGGYVSIGWANAVPDLSDIIGKEKVSARDRIREWILPRYAENPGVASRKAGEILKFAEDIAENDIVVACEGQKVLGIGRVRGAYEYEDGLRFPHKRPVEWLLLEPWQMPEQEGLLTTVYELGRSAENLLSLEKKLFFRDRNAPAFRPRLTPPEIGSSVAPLPPLDPIAARVDNVLRRKGQLVLYGPPGTGKTFHALRIARELAARQIFRKPFSALTVGERQEIDDPAVGAVRLCTFHPGYGYEDFIEGLRPKTVEGQMTFEQRDGIFKKLCADAERRGNHHFFLVVDEINRGDIPRIFGELITVIESDKRNRAIILPASGSPFVVPSNVSIIGTMNTADRSISLLDLALRRRFGFIELLPDSSTLANRIVGGLPLGPWLDALNARLRRLLKRDARNLQIGHAYLLNPPITSVAEFARVLREDIVPLLEEYCYDDFSTLRDILGNALVDVEGARIRDDIFEPNKEEDLIQALLNEEVQSLVLAQGITEDESTGEISDDLTDEGEDAQSPPK